MRRSLVRSLLSLLVLAPLAACGDDPIGPGLPENVEFDASLGVDLDAMTKLSSGVYIQTLTEGEGVPIIEGDRVFVDFTLWLPDGTEVASGPFNFTLGVDNLIEGFEIGVTGMLKGETRLIVIPSNLGYGTAGTTGIPPNSVLVYQVEVTDVNPPI